MEAPTKPVLEDAVAFAAGRLCLDFVNTACMRYAEPLDLWPDAERFRLWLRSAGREYGFEFELPAEGEEDSLARACELRTALWDLVEAMRNGRSPSANALKTVNAVLRANPAYPQLEFGEQGFRPVAQRLRTEDPWLAEVARDAVDLLSRGDVSLLRQCEGATCIRVFYDTSKNHKRRWCVEKCGNRVKSANYYRRKRGLPDPHEV